jgi:hypothetical protein
MTGSSLTVVSFPSGSNEKWDIHGTGSSPTMESFPSGTCSNDKMGYPRGLTGH